jgi:hypothetical protein
MDFIRSPIHKWYIGAAPGNRKWLNDDGAFEGVSDYGRKLRAAQIRKKVWKLGAG